MLGLKTVFLRDNCFLLIALLWTMDAAASAAKWNNKDMWNPPVAPCLRSCVCHCVQPQQQQQQHRQQNELAKFYDKRTPLASPHATSRPVENTTK